MRWNAGLATVALIAGLAGCRQQSYLTEADAKQYLAPTALIPPNLESDLHMALSPGSGNLAKPMTVLDTNRQPRPIRLAECIAIALEQGNVGSQSALFPGIANDTLAQFNGRAVGASDSIRVLALDPAIAAADIESASARFDARWLTSLTWTKTDQAINNILQNFSNGDSASFSSGLFKPLPSGGLAGLSFNNNYSLLSQAPSQQITNPSWRPQLQVLFEQPLLAFYGVEYNQVSSAQPGSVLIPGLRPSGGTRTEGILITRLRFDQARAEFERNVNFMLLNVEYAYWNLYGAYYTLYSREQGLKQALVSWQVGRQRLENGLIPEQDLQQVRAQYETFRAQRFQALGQVLDRERQLRGLLGLPIEDGTRLVPVDEPTLTAYKPDWSTAVNETLALRPELILSRQDLKFRQLDMINARNQLKPDLRLFATYDVNGLGTRLDGGPVRFITDPNIGQVQQPGNAFASLTDNIFNSWQVGLRLDMPIGFRDANAAVQSARSNLARSYWSLQDQEAKAQRFLALQYRQLEEFYETIGALEANRLANVRQLELRFERFRQGVRQETIDVLLEAQRNLADALANEYTAIVNYNNALAGFHFAKGTIMLYDNVNIAEGALPGCAQVRAVEHFRQRNLALPVRERADPAVYQAGCELPTEVPSNALALPLIPGQVPPSRSAMNVPPAPPMPPAAQMPVAGAPNLPSGR